MGQLEIQFFLALFVAITAANSNYYVMGPQPRPFIRKLGGGGDRSVYARRSFALPDVVSDVYEVYLGPSEISVRKDATNLIVASNNKISLRLMILTLY